MPTLSELQDQTALQLVEKLQSPTEGRGLLLNLIGAAGCGKTSVLRRVADKLRREEPWFPVLLAAPNRDNDSGAIALLETAGQLKVRGLLNGEMATLSDPRRPWADKMAAITEVVDRHCDDVVILCDEPALWYQGEESLLEDTPQFSARSFAEWIASGARCRRIVTGWVPGDARPADRVTAPRLDDGREMLAHEKDWGILWDSACGLRESLPEPVPYRSAWAMKLCVALAALLPADEAASVTTSEASANVILKQLLDQVERRVGYRDFCANLAKLALARTHLEKAVLDELMLGLGGPERALIGTCLLDRLNGRATLHPLVRDEVLRRHRTSGRVQDSNPWRLRGDRRMAVHDRLAQEYADDGDSDLRNSLESLHHELLGSSFHLMASDRRIRFKEQLDAIGRTLSYRHHQHPRAVKVFRLAVQLDPEHAYAHHYLAYNLDWLAENTEALESHYRRAIDLQPTHPWFWSRWICYLATRGRGAEAKAQWHEAVCALSISEDDTPGWIFRALHRWVARWLLHWAELDFAEMVLREIPGRVAKYDASIQALFSLLESLKHAERGKSVFPLNVPPREWRSQEPHTDLPRWLQDARLRSWIPARVEGIDREDGVAFLLAAELPRTRDSDFGYFETELRRGQVEASASGFTWDDLGEGAFLELGYYGDGDGLMRIALHRDTTWHDPNLLPLYPRPDRWYQRAVEEAWAENAEAD
ncbi:MAG: hypothetical protein ACLQIB_18145 [Isosphaeraceae bacterium]